MVGQLAGQQQLGAGEDLLGGERLLLIISDQLGSQHANLVENVVDHRIHNVHGLLANPLGRVHLLEHLVDIEGEGLLPLLPASLAGRRHLLHGFVPLSAFL